MKRCRKLYFDSRFGLYCCASTAPCYKNECAPATLFRSSIRLVGSSLFYQIYSEE